MAMGSSFVCAALDLKKALPTATTEQLNFAEHAGNEVAVSYN
ncbi:hypothetical protein RDI61_26495 [Pseudomonas plecoglossicida]|nr:MULTISPECIES: hypothetical protein [Pseudomonas]MDQ7967538.1 hypothetical protein [Pseudomonas plecoglossicida]WFG04009.1 hypothetical protein P3X84_05140 [Pseudomonas putida]